MQVSPRYGDVPIMRIESGIDDPATPLLRQRARLADLLAGLDAEQWAAPTRCEDWSVQDVTSHLVTTNQFWALSITAGLEGAPTRYLEGFDPVATPAQLVDAVRGCAPAETLERYRESCASLSAAIGSMDADAWDTLAEAPPGHIAIRLVALHALWDAWIHERDIAIPLGLAAVEESDEIVGALTYVAGLGPAFLASIGSTRTGSLEVHGIDPDVRVVIDVGSSIVLHEGPGPSGTVTLTGDSVELVEALSFRAPFTATVADGDRWLLGGLDQVFDQPA